MVLEMKWELRNDPWLDNGLEVFSKVVESVKNVIHQDHDSIYTYTFKNKG